MQMMKGKHETGGFKNTSLQYDPESVIAEQKRFIEMLKEDKARLEGRIVLLEKERKTVLNVLDLTQRNSEEIIRQAKAEAQNIVADARMEAARIRNIAGGPLRDVLDMEATLSEILDMIRQLKEADGNTDWKKKNA
ncbi:hypothetical protein SDC9_160644 [bioreactor metagenome]|uniref:Uncharacterized protein n=1 Tax=bioreactor metagenome TaxID=1076179 RepID=A0A645FMA4_9ZZZZ